MLLPLPLSWPTPFYNASNEPKINEERETHEEDEKTNTWSGGGQNDSSIYELKNSHIKYFIISFSFQHYMGLRIYDP